MGDWLPPRAPDWQPQQRFERAPERPVPDRPVFVPGPAGGRTNGLAVGGLVLGITGLTLLLLSVGTLFVLTIPCSIAAWLLSARARIRIATGQEEGGAGQAKWGYVLGVAGVVLGVVAMVTWIILIGSGFSVEEFRDNLEEELERRRNRDTVDATLVHLRAWIGR
jgi:hypothetical protein